MNKDLQDKYIFDFLEGNLSQKEEALFHDLVNEDVNFRNEYLGWKDMYFHTTTDIISFDKKTELKKGTILSRKLIIDSLIVILMFSVTFLGYRNYQLEHKEITTITSVIKPETSNSRNPKKEDKIYKSTTQIPSNHTLQKRENKKPVKHQASIENSVPRISNRNLVEGPILSNIIIKPTEFTDTTCIQSTLANKESKDTLQTKIVLEEVVTTSSKQQTVEIKRSKQAKKILRKEKRNNKKVETPDWTEIKEALKDQKVIPVD